MHNLRLGVYYKYIVDRVTIAGVLLVFHAQVKSFSIL